MLTPSPTDPHRHIDARSSRLERASQAVKRTAARYLGLAATQLLTPTGLEDKDVRARLWRRGIAAQPSGFYASLVDPVELSASDAPLAQAGVDFNRDRQFDYLVGKFPRFRDEYRALRDDRPLDWATRPRFFLDNDAFQNVDPLVYWALIRLHRPARIVEIGSGFSTLLAAEAVQKNGTGRVTGIDPFPREFVRRNDLDIELICQPVEQLDTAFFRSLKENDMLFVDSSHVVRAGGDVNWIVLDVLPHLSPGVLVHFHDIHFPFDYPRELIDRRNVYWTEQYLLHAYLLRNRVDEVLFGTRYAAHHFHREMSLAFPVAKRLDGASFWLRVGAMQAKAAVQPA
jgi:predicted O-methyltransferase YrrM